MPVIGLTCTLMIRSGCFGGHFLDIHAAILAGNDGDTWRSAIGDDRKIQFLLDADTLSPPGRFYQSPSGPVCLVTSCHSEDCRAACSASSPVRDFDSSALPPSSGMNLGLDRHWKTKALASTATYLQVLQTPPSAVGTSILSKKLFRLVFVNLHRYHPQTERRSPRPIVFSKKGRSCHQKQLPGSAVFTLSFSHSPSC
jgi:hypothetical protein